MSTRIVVFSGTENEVMTRAQLFEEAAELAGSVCNRPFEGDVDAAVLRRSPAGGAATYCIVVKETNELN